MGRSGSARTTRFTSIFLTLTLVIGITMLVSTPAFAASLVVDTTSDSSGADGVCSLREAIGNANDDASTSADCAAGSGVDTISFAVTGTITLDSTLPSFTGDLTIDGPGAANLAVSGNNQVPVFTSSSGTLTVINGLTAINGSRCSGGSGGGGGILNGSGTMTIRDAVVADSFACNSGGGITNQGTLTIENSIVSGNSAGSDGGGIDNNGSITVFRSTISHNVAPFSGGLSNDGGTATVTDSTVANNSASRNGGGITNSRGTLVVANSTVSGNTAGGDGGGILNILANAEIRNSTIAGNQAEFGGGIEDFSTHDTITSSTIAGNSARGGANCVGGYPTCGGGGVLASGTTVLSNTIVAGNGSGNDCLLDETILDNGYNLDSDASCGFSGTSSSVPAPGLGALADNGGPTRTMALLPGSPALERIPVGTSGCGSTIVSDQRGVSRPQDTLCDIGAFEAAVDIVLPSYTFTEFGPPIDAGGENVAKAGSTIPLKFNVADANGIPVSGLTIPPLVISSTGGPCSGGPTDTMQESAVGGGLKEKGNGSYQFNWKTPKIYAGQCRTLTASLGGSSVSVLFRFK